MRLNTSTKYCAECLILLPKSTHERFLQQNPNESPISQPLALDPGERVCRALHIIHFKRDAIVIAERKLTDVAIQVARANVLVHATNAHLEGAEKTFDRVGCYVAASVFLSSMIYGFMAGKVLADFLVHTSAIGHEARGLGNLPMQDRLERICSHCRHMESADAALAPMSDELVPSQSDAAEKL